MSKLDLETAKSIAREVLNALPGGMSIRTKSAKSGTSSPDDLSLQFVAYAHRTIADTVRAMKEGDIEKEGEPRFYVFSGKESGCAFISAEDTDNPVLGYTDSAENDFSDIPGGLLDLMESWRLAADVESTKVSKVSSATQRMATRGKGHMLFSPVVEPLLKTKWKQRSPYNYFCPKGYPAGCAAIAMAQVIRYYEWPKRGKGTHQYDDSSTPCWDFSYNQPDADSACPGLSIVKYGCGASDSVKIDFENTEYDYFNMPWKLDRNVDGMTSLRVEEKWSAALVRHCATAVNMDFWQAGSHPDLGKGGGAGNQTYLMGLEGLHDHFRYNNASEKHYYKTGWGKDVRNCLDEFRPVVFYSLNDMHFYICDGYGYADPKKSILYHFNFGWGGAWDGYYKEGEVKPNDSNYNLTQYVCTNLRPDAPYIILDVVFNLPDFKPLHYTANMESESIASPIFPYGKTPAVLDYDKVFRLEKSITYCGYQYVIDAIRINGIDNKIQPGSNRFTIKASQLERVGKVEVMMKPATNFSVGGIEYKPLSYKEVAVVNYSNVRPVINQTVTFNGIEYAITGIDFSSIERNGKNKTTVAITANYITGLDKQLSSFTKLERVEFNSVKDIPAGTFSGLSNLLEVSMIGAESVGSNAFSGCISLKRVNCPKLTYIKDGAFKDCAKLQELPSDSIFSFGSSAFKNCISLTKASSRGCSSLSDSAFSGCTALTSISFLSLSVIGNHAFEGCSELLEANLDSLRTVGEGAFKNCKRLESFPFEKMKTIGAYAFQNCTSLSTVTISGTVSIAQGAFCGCTALKSFSASKILDGYIHDDAFSGCCQLKEVAPTTFRYVGAGSFSSCKLLNANFVLGDVYSRAFYDAITDTANPATIVFQPFTKSLGDNAFYGGKAIKCIYSFADTPPACGKNAFKGVPADIPVYVNYHSILKYKTADVWKDFTNIQCTEIVEGGVRYRIVDSNNAVVVGYDKTTVLKTINFVFGKVGESDKTAINQAYGQEVVTEFGINLISCLTIKKAVTIMSRQFEVTSINPGTFKNTLECLSISLGGSQITSKAFAGCTEFKAIVVSSSTPPIVAADAFVASKQSKETFLIVPKNAVDNYKKDAVWNRFRIVSFDCPFKVDTLQLTALDNRLKQEILKHYIHDRLKDNLQDLLGLVSGNWRDIPQLLADKKDFSKAASELFDKVNNVPNGFELILPDSIKDRLDGANTQLSNGILRDAVQSLGKVQLYGSIGEKIDIEKYIKTPGGLVADLVIDGRLEIKDVIAKPITPIKKTSFRPIRIINRIVTLLNPVFEYEDNLSIAAQRFTDMLQSQLSPYFADKKYQVVKPGKEMSQVKKGQVFIGLHLSDKAAQMKADLLK